MTINKNQEFTIDFYDLESLENFLNTSYQHQYLWKVTSQFSCIKVWFTDQNSKSLEIEHRVNVDLVLYSWLKILRCKVQHAMIRKKRLEVKGSSLFYLQDIYTWSMQKLQKILQHNRKKI